MRKTFAKELQRHMEKNPNIWLLTGDLGYHVFDEIRDAFPDRFVNCGASEQAMAGIATGLALKGKVPFVYSITTFLLRRPYETIKLYLDGEKIPVKLVGSGLEHDYENDGFSHWPDEIHGLFRILPNIKTLWPKDKESIGTMVEKMVNDASPYFIGLRR